MQEKATLLDIDNRITSKQKSLNDFLGHSCYGSEWERNQGTKKKDILILPWSEDWYSVQKTENILLFLCSSDI